MNRLDETAALIAVRVQGGDKEEKNRIIEVATKGYILTLDKSLTLAKHDKDLLD